MKGILSVLKEEADPEGSVSFFLCDDEVSEGSVLMESLETIIELYVSKAGFWLDRSFAAVHLSTVICK